MFYFCFVILLNTYNYLGFYLSEVYFSPLDLYTVGSEIQSGFQMVEKMLGCKWSKIWMGSEILKPNQFKSWQMAAMLPKTIWIPDKIVRISNGPVSNGWD